MTTDNHRVNRSTRANVFEMENLLRVPGYAYRYPTEDQTESLVIVHIAKPIRAIGYFSVTLTGTALFIAFTRHHLGAFSLILSPIVFVFLNVVGGMPIDAFDLWLRRRTKDPIWLMTEEGQRWLDTPQGKDWSRERS